MGAVALCGRKKSERLVLAEVWTTWHHLPSAAWESLHTKESSRKDPWVFVPRFTANTGKATAQSVESRQMTQARYCSLLADFPRCATTLSCGPAFFRSPVLSVNVAGPFHHVSSRTWWRIHLSCWFPPNLTTQSSGLLGVERFEGLS